MNAQTLRLQPGCALALDAASGTRVLCIDGLLWLTQDGETDDLVLSASHSWTARRRGRIVVQALRSRAACAIEPSDEAFTVGARLAGRARAWAARLVAVRFDPA
jgi:hypothetical protein